MAPACAASSSSLGRRSQGAGRFTHALVALLAAGCTGAGTSVASTIASTEPMPAPRAAPRSARLRSAWPDVTRSPWPASGSDAREAALASACGDEDGALARVARELVGERVRGLSKPEADRVPSLLRAHGEPHVAPRLVLASGRAPLDDDELREELASVKRPSSRCGVALARTAQNKELLVAVAVDALADLEPLPTRARVGEWLTVSAKLHLAASGAKVIVLGPRGLPRAVPTSLDPRTGAIRARFAPDHAGTFIVQVVGDIDGGPRPLLEARVFAGTEPSRDDEQARAPGEEAGARANDSEALARIVSALRASEGLAPLARDDRLDAIALAHAAAMRAARRLAHDVGDGDVRTRFEEAGLVARSVGENVARARSVALAHRALHASPSHRANLLRREHTHVGLAVVADDAGDVYVCQVFAVDLR